MHDSRSHDAVIRVYDDAGNVIETHEHAGDFKEPMNRLATAQPFNALFALWFASLCLNS
jgi:hypothetical protein